MFRALAILLLTGTAFAQPPQKPKFLYGHDLKVRNVGQKNFDNTTPKVGVEVFQDPVTGAVIAISEDGYLAVTAATISDQKKTDWMAAFELRVRPANEETFAKAVQYAGEQFKDLGTGKLLTIMNKKSIAFSDAGTASDQEPAWHHALVLKVRGSADKDFTNAGRLGVEVYKDGTSGGLIYLAENGMIACSPAPATPPVPDAVKAPKAMHGLTLMARKADEGDFVLGKTKSYGVEVYFDPNSGATLYVSDTGSIAAVTIPETKKDQGVKWSHSFVLRPRKAGEKDFEKAAKFGIECYEDKNTGAMIYICENGSIAVWKK